MIAYISINNLPNELEFYLDEESNLLYNKLFYTKDLIPFLIKKVKQVLKEEHGICDFKLCMIQENEFIYKTTNNFELYYSFMNFWIKNKFDLSIQITEDSFLRKMLFEQKYSDGIEAFKEYLKQNGHEHITLK